MIPLGPRGPVTGVADPTNKIAAGNWTVTFDPNTMNTQVPYTEVCKMVITNAAVGAFVQIYIGDFLWDSVQQGYNNSWDPNVALPYKPGQYVYFYFSTAADGHPPIMSVWLRYDQDIKANANVAAPGIPQASS